MNAERLLGLYDRIADAPDAVARLRRFILDLAVRGKLLPQESLQANPTTASQIDGMARQLPHTWLFVPLSELLESSFYGPRFGAHEYSPTGIPTIRTTDMTDDGKIILKDPPRVNVPGDRVEAFKCKRGDLLVTRTGSIGIMAVFDADYLAVPSAYLIRFRFSELVSPFYVQLFLKSSLGQDALGLGTTRVAQPNINAKNIAQIQIPLPPRAEQHRIIAKVDALIALCDRLEAARAERESTRDKLAAASLARLSAPDPDPTLFAAHGRFALDNIAALATRPDQIKQIRQAILNLAVRGKLVAQDTQDVPAAELLKSTIKEKVYLAAAGEIRKEKPQRPITEADQIFELPTNWTWVRLGEISRMVTSGSRDWAQHYADDGAIFVRMGNLSKGDYRLRLDHIQRVKPPADGEGTRTRLEAGDILISITGEVGMLGLIPDGFGEAYINQHTAMVRPMPALKGRFLAELFRSPFAQEQFNAPQRGIKNSFRLTDVTEFIVPLPPLAEQHRIVKKVDALMALCDQLEASLTATEATRRRLLEALLAEALEPACPRELELAE